MNFNKLFVPLTLTAMMGAGLSSCSNEMNDPTLNEAAKGMLVRAPKAVAYSGNHYWDMYGSGAYGTRSGAELTSQECRTSLIDRAHEEEIIDEWLPEKNGNLKEGIKTDFLFYADQDLSLEFYPVFSQTTTANSLGVYYWDEEGNYHEKIVWEKMDPWGLSETDYDEPVPDSWVEDPNHWSGEGGYYAEYGVTYSKGIQINVPAGCTFGFYWKGHNNTGETVYYSSSDRNEEVNCTDGAGNPLPDGSTSKIHAVTFQLEGKTYLGLEDWTDFDFQDWVFTCDKELKTVDSSTFQPGDKGDDNNGGNTDSGDNNGNEDNGDNGGNEDNGNPGDNGDNGGNTGGDVVETPAVPGDNHTNEVEINLGLDEKESGDELTSHLSIHVRAATDVEVFIPVPRQYYCDADDMAIVMKHEGNHMAYNDTESHYEFTYVLKDSELAVTLHVDFEDEGIRIWTDGITQEVIDWCQEKCNDGITFEVWNYFNDPDVVESLPNGPISMDDLKYLLNMATVTFLDEVPDYYINAFGQANGKYDANDESTHGNNDFHVTPTAQGDQFSGPVEGEHLNGSANNEIYTNKSMDSNQ